MTPYSFRSWLTFAEAADYLSSKTNYQHTEQSIEDAVNSETLRAFFYTPDEIALYFDDRPSGLPGSINLAECPHFLFDYESSQAWRAHIAENTPIPIVGYHEFCKNIENRNKPNPCGITIYGPDGAVLGGVYSIGDNGQPCWITDTAFQLFIRKDELDELIKGGEARWRRHTSNKLYMMLVPLESFPAELGRALFLENPEGIPQMDEYIIRMLAGETSNKSEPATNDTDTKGLPAAQKALALSARLIAELGGLLQEFAEHSNNPEKLTELANAARKTYGIKYGFGSRDKPAVEGISRQLSSLAMELGHKDGAGNPEHGYGPSGFQKTIKTALEAL